MWDDPPNRKANLGAVGRMTLRPIVEHDLAPTLLVFTDSDFASCPYTSKRFSKSTSGVVYVLQTGSSYFPLLWSSKKQNSTARSTTEAELIACASALFGEAFNLHTMIESLTEVRVPVSFQQDNQAAITVIQSGYSAKLRHAGRVHRVNVTSNNWIKVFLTWITAKQPLSQNTAWCGHILWALCPCPKRLCRWFSFTTSWS